MHILLPLFSEKMEELVFDKKTSSKLVSNLDLKNSGQISSLFNNEYYSIRIIKKLIEIGNFHKILYLKQGLNCEND